MENSNFLTEQIITYIGNKRQLLKVIEKNLELVLSELKSDKVVLCDLFSGSGIVARKLKQYASLLYANDLERYSYIINNCYLTNPEDFDEKSIKNIMITSLLVL